jgi:hypothetical protein
MRRRRITKAEMEFDKRRERRAAALEQAWLRDHPGQTTDDYERVGSCVATAREARDFERWLIEHGGQDHDQRSI